MRAIRIEEFGGPEKLVLAYLPTPEPGPDEVRIRVHAAGVNFADTLMLRGRYQATPPLPFTPGMEVAGEVVQAGADIKWLNAVRQSSPQGNLDASRQTAEVVQRLNLMPIPTIALVHGACFGGGTGIISACDIVIAAHDATFSIAEVKIGVAGTIIIPQLVDAIGLRQVRRYALTGERFDAEEAMRIGLVHEIVAPSELEAAGERIVDHLLANGPEAVSATKICAMRSAWSHLDEAAFDALVEAHANKRQSKETAEGFAAFIEKRPARWVPGPKGKA